MSFNSDEGNLEELNQSLKMTGENELKLLAKMIDGIRQATGISHNSSQIALQSVLFDLSANFPELGKKFSSLQQHLNLKSVVAQVPELIQNSSDAHDLMKLFKSLVDLKNDEQQRSWHLHEDEESIINNISLLTEILTNADSSIFKYVMRKDEYRSLNDIVLYYQMEPRHKIRNVLIETFVRITYIDREATITLANSVLPMELAREFQEVEDEAARIKFTLLLTHLMCTGEPMPVTHYEYLGTDLIKLVFEMIERDDYLIARGALIKFLLAFNLQFRGSEHNLTVHAMSHCSTATNLSQEMIALINRQSDPLIECPNYEHSNNSSHKFLIDVLSFSQTAKLFYMNDINVLIDIIIRSLTDLGRGDENRSFYLSLLQQIILNTDYMETKYRKVGLEDCMKMIIDEESESESTAAAFILKSILT